MKTEGFFYQTKYNSVSQLLSKWFYAFVHFLKVVLHDAIFLAACVSRVLRDKFTGVSGGILIILKSVSKVVT